MFVYFTDKKKKLLFVTPSLNDKNVITFIFFLNK